MVFKRLKLPNWVKYDLEEEQELLGGERYQEIAPTFNRDGWYYNRLHNFSWFEVRYNKLYRAFKEENPKQFLYELQLHSHVPLTTEEIYYIKSVLLYRKNEKLSELLYRDLDWKQLNEIHRGRFKAYKRFDEFKKNLKNVQIKLNIGES